MNRRQLLLRSAAMPLLAGRAPAAPTRALAASPSSAFQRARPGDAAWPSEARWAELGQRVGGRLTKLSDPLKACRDAAPGAACDELFKSLKNPHFIGDSPALTQTLGWVDAWTSRPSAYAVAAQTTADVVAAIDFARTHRLRLVVKGGGHSYQGTSNAADSLLVWTRGMRSITLHDAFVADGCTDAPSPAVTVEAGALWGPVFDAVTTRGGRYLQGGGCLTVGVAGLVQSGGFGSFSKGFGTASLHLLQAEVVTADGAVRIANAGTNPELFWGLKGGGGGSLGVGHAADAAHPRAARVGRRGEHDDQGEFRRRVPAPDRADHHALPRAADEPAPGRADRLHARQRAADRDGVPGPGSR